MSDQAQQPVAEGRLTAMLAQSAADLRHETIPQEILKVARQCVLDWIGVTLAASKEPLVRILLKQMNEQGGHLHATIIGHSDRLPTLAAALVNGATSHALDYDDVNLSMTGHPTVAVLPGLLALAEQRKARGADLIAAFVAGYETVCSIGALIGSGHYARGFHSTGTLGSFGSAAACANLLRLDGMQTATALGIAGTQAAGLKSMFGTMCKPLHAGRAAYNGLFAALAAADGFDSRPDVLETQQGFASTQSDGLKSMALPEQPGGGYYLRNNLFKYHAACYLTHAAIECARRLREAHVADISRIAKVVIRVDASCDKVCNIRNPHTGLEAKFSLRQTAAFALSGVDTARLDTYGEPALSDPRVLALRDRIAVELLPSRPHTQADVILTLDDGKQFSMSHDSGVPASDIEEQGRRIDAKFLGLAEPVLGRSRAEEVVDAVRRLDTLSSVFDLTRLLVPTNK